MEIVGLYRYPVKSAQGEALDSAAIGEHGITGDRSHALIDVETGVALTGRLDPSLLFATGMLSEDGRASLRLPDGTVTADDVVISAWIGRPVHLAGAVAAPSTYEIRVDAEDESSEIVSWKGPSGVYHDSARTRVSIVATGDLRDWDVRRFRPNVVVDGDTVDHLVGRSVRLGNAVLDIVKQIDRCVMITRPQPGGIERELDVLRTVRDERAMLLGVGGLVVKPDEITVGDGLVALGD